MNRIARHVVLARNASPLSSTVLAVTIVDLVAEYVMTHHFRNQGAEAIEAVFSFPVPLDVAFMGMRATLAGESLESTVRLKDEASREYDDAIADGNSAVLLRAPEPGLLCISLGNLKAGEDGEIELRFASPLRVADREARFSLPLVNRPRYGQWRLDELDVPTHDFAIEHPMTATISVQGLLARAPVHCATHPSRFQQQGESMVLSIEHGMLDRDLVLAFELDQGLAPSGRLGVDGDALIGMASLVVPAPDAERRPVNLCLVMDGSGSMTGDAIDQSRDAMTAVIESLQEADRVQVIRFGSSTSTWFRRPLKATPRVRQAMRTLTQTLNSDLGGTEMGVALQLALKQLAGASTEGVRAAIILVTDGAVQAEDLKSAKRAALDAGVRVFVVAVGGSAGVEVLEPFAQATGATLERAVPAEPIGACVMRQLRRAQADALGITVTWPSSNAVPLPSAVAYPGDAIALSAMLPAGSSGHVLLAVPALAFVQRVALGSPAEEPALRALFGLRRYHAAKAGKRADIALRYGLLTEDTSAVLVKVRAEIDKADGLPHIVQVPQMVPGGMVLECSKDIRFSRKRTVDASPDDYLDMPSFLRRQPEFDAVQDEPSPPPRRSWLDRLRKAKPLELRRIPAVPAERVREILQSIYALLRATYLDDPFATLTLDEVIKRLPDDDREDSRRTVGALASRVAFADPMHARMVLIKLESLFGAASPDDEVEAWFAELSVGMDPSLVDRYCDVRVRDLLNSGMPDLEG